MGLIWIDKKMAGGKRNVFIIYSANRSFRIHWPIVRVPVMYIDYPIELQYVDAPVNCALNKHGHFKHGSTRLTVDSKHVYRAGGSGPNEKNHNVKNPDG